MQSPRLLNGPFRIGGDLRRRFQAHEAVDAAARLVDRTQHVRCIADVLDGDFIVNRAGFGRPTRERFAHRVVILPTAVNSLFEDRRIARNPAQAILLDQSF